MPSLEAAAVEALLARKATLAVAESMTGGLLGGRITTIPGSADAFRGGIVSYVDDVKAAHLNVDRRVLDEVGAISAPVAEQMARGCRERFGSTLAVSITGAAGPNAPPGVPVGLYFIGLATPDGLVTVHERRAGGGREAVREAAVRDALELVLAWARSG